MSSSNSRYFSLFGLLVSSVLFSLLLAGWFLWVSPTKIALVNFTDNRYAQVVEANDNFFIRLERLTADELKKRSLSDFDAVYYMKKGGRPAPEEAGSLLAAAEKETSLLIFTTRQQEDPATNMARDRATDLKSYLVNGGLLNLRAFLDYNRRIIDGKRFAATIPVKPSVLPDDVFFHTEKGVYFENYAGYQAFYKTKGLYKKDGPRVCLTVYDWGLSSSNRGYINTMIRLLEKKGINVYPIAGRKKRLDFIEKIHPDLIISTSLGRLGRNETERSLAILKKINAPLLHPLDIHLPYEKWLQNPQGISGGLLSQQVVIPEMDGAIEPFSISAEFSQKGGYRVLQAIPGRLEKCVDRVERWLTLKKKSNRDKRVAIFYFKGLGQNSLKAAGLDVVPSLLNLLRNLKKNGFKTGPLPVNAEELAAMIQRQGPVFGEYAKGAFQEFLRHGAPELIPVKKYLAWCKKDLSSAMYKDVEKLYGPAPGQYLSIKRENISYIALPRLILGNITLIPQLPPALGADRYTLVHGIKKAPPHPYIAGYLWAREGFGADAFIHFGTHGSLEFTPWKQNALSSEDWPDALAGDLPHLYLYVINNIGEAVIAKRRTYAVIDSHLTPPFAEVGLYGQLSDILSAIHSFEKVEAANLKAQYKKTIIQFVLRSGLDKDLELGLTEQSELTDEIIEKIHRYIHTVKQEKITSGLYTLGEKYPPKKIRETVKLMAIDNLSYRMAGMDEIMGKLDPSRKNDPHFFATHYRKRAGEYIDKLLLGQITVEDLVNKAKKNMGSEYKKVFGKYKNALYSVAQYKTALEQSPAKELQTVINFLSGGYIEPSTGGDPIINPDAVPTGRNMFSIDVEKTPTPEAWDIGVKMVAEIIARKKSKTGRYPKKIAMTLWGGEYIRSGGVELAMIFDFLGVEPVRSRRGKIIDLQLVPSKKMHHPRIDVVIQTSGQFRDIAASRIFLINRAVAMAASAQDGDELRNYVREATVEAEKTMKEKGMSPLDARTFSTARVFGSADGNYGTGIIGLVQSGGKRDDNTIADRYLQNMGAVYTRDHWGVYSPGLFEGALKKTDTVVNKRSSNVWGPLSLDHVYEFMGGISTSIRKVTGRDPDAYFTDLRNQYNGRVQGAKEAIWTESRASVMNPTYIRELQKNGAFGAEKMAHVFRNTYGWNVMKPAEIDPRMWDEFYNVYIKDTLNLGMKKYFRKKNPFALEDMTAVMLETIRRGYWKPGEETIKNLAGIHGELIRDFKAGCSTFVCNNPELRQMISSVLPTELAKTYNREIDRARIGVDTQKVQGMKLNKDVLQLKKAKMVVIRNMPAVLTLMGIVALFALAVVLGIRRRKE